MHPTLLGLSSLFKEQVSGLPIGGLPSGFPIGLNQPKALPLLLSLTPMKTLFFLKKRKKKIDELTPDVGDQS